MADGGASAAFFATIEHQMAVVLPINFSIFAD